MLRVNQAIAKTGYCSRRKADELIAAGRVRLNNKVITEFNQKVDLEKDQLSIDGKLLAFKHLTYIVINKPKGVVTTMKDTHDRQTVIDLLPPKLQHLRPVGRLDMYSSGLLLLTNDGDLANKLIHPSSHIPKMYQVRVRGNLKKDHIQQIETGIELEDGITLPCQVKQVSFNGTHSTFMLTIYEGRNRQIRRMLSALDYAVVELTRLSLGKLQLDRLENGKWRYLNEAEINSLKALK